MFNIIDFFNAPFYYINIQGDIKKILGKDNA